jgi:hypothetical protein
VNRSFLSSLAAVRTRSSPGDTLARLGVRRVPACPVFSSAPSLRSTNSGSGRPSPFAGFPATMEGSDFSSPCITGFGSSPSRCGPDFTDPGRRRDLPVPAQEAYAHAGAVQALALARPSVLPSTQRTVSASRRSCFRGSIPSLCAPLSTLHRNPRGFQRMTRGQCGCRVEVPVTRHLPHRSRRAAFPHRALVEGLTRSWVWTPPIRRLAASVTC